MSLSSWATSSTSREAGEGESYQYPLRVRRLVALLLLMPLVACGGGGGTPAKQALPTHKVGRASALAELGGVLRGSAASECLWVQAADRIDVSWPDAYSMSVDPVALRDSKGRIVARDGQRVSLTGGYRPQGSPTRCSEGRDAFHADYVSRQN
jgi:hypothetical protein